MPQMPPYGEFIFGHEYAGDVVAVGRTVDEFRVGDRVVVEAHMGCRRCENCIRGLYTACLNYGNRTRGHRANGFTTNGGLAEYAVNHVNTLYRIPEGVSYEEATVVMTSGSPLFGLENAGGYFAGETVAVLGPGPIGLMAIQLVKALGATRVILTGTRASRLAMGRQLGADVVVNSREQEPIAAVMGATGGKGADLVIDCAGGDETFDQSLKMVKSGGKVLLVAFYHGPVTADVSHAVRRNVTIYTERGEGGTSVGRALALLAAGRLTAKPLITHQFPLSRVHEAFEVLENRTGAGGALGYTYVKGQPADGHALVWNSNSISTAYHAGNMKLDHTAFAGVVALTSEPVSLAVKADAPWKDARELLAHARANPGHVRLGNSGRGSFTHLVAVALENCAGVKLTHVPFGRELAVTTVLGDKIEASVQLPAEIMVQVTGRQVRVLAVSGDTRLVSLPDAPTLREAGVDLTMTLWRGVAVPKGTPETAIARLERAFTQAANGPEFRDFAARMGAVVDVRGAKDFDAFMARDDREIAALMEQIGLRKQ